MKINFQDDTIAILYENIPLLATSSGHYAIPITKAKQIINNFKRGSTNSITLALPEVKGNYKVALKLHRQFPHPTQEKLLKVINNVGHPWSTKNELKQKIKKYLTPLQHVSFMRRLLQGQRLSYQWRPGFRRL